MSEESQKILSMLSEGKINVAEAEKLLEALKSTPQQESSSQGESKGKPRYLRVLVNKEKSDGCCGEQVNIRVPLQLLKAGVKLASLLPEESRDEVNSALKEHKINFDLSSLKDGQLDELVEALRDMTIDVDDKGSKVKIFCE